MGSFKLGKISLKGMFGTSPCKLYPVKAPEYYKITKGHIENKDIKGCILCGICERKCPTHAITVDKAAETWSIDPFSCIQCSSCVRECPKNCLAMINTYTAPAAYKQNICVKKPPLTPEEQAAKAKADADKAERIRLAKEKQAAKKAAEGYEGV